MGPRQRIEIARSQPIERGSKVKLHDTLPTVSDPLSSEPIPVSYRGLFRDAEWTLRPWPTRPWRQLPANEFDPIGALSVPDKLRDTAAIRPGRDELTILFLLWRDRCLFYPSQTERILDVDEQRGHRCSNFYYVKPLFVTRPQRCSIQFHVCAVPAYLDTDVGRYVYTPTSIPISLDNALDCHASHFEPRG